MGAAFADPDQHAAARVIVGLVTADVHEPTAAEVLAHDLGASDLTSTEVAAGAAVLLDRVLADVTAALRLDRAETVALLGRWVAADEFAGQA